MNLVKKFISDEAGAASVEYGMIAVVVAVVLAAAMPGIGTSIEGQFDSVAREME